MLPSFSFKAFLSLDHQPMELGPVQPEGRIPSNSFIREKTHKQLPSQAGKDEKIAVL